MSVDEIRQAVIEAVATVVSLEPSDIKEDARFVEDLGLDSLARLEILVELERSLNLKFPGSGVPEGVRTVKDTVELVTDLCAGVS